MKKALLCMGLFTVLFSIFPPAALSFYFLGDIGGGGFHPRQIYASVNTGSSTMDELYGIYTHAGSDGPREFMIVSEHGNTGPVTVTTQYSIGGHVAVTSSDNFPFELVHNEPLARIAFTGMTGNIEGLSGYDFYFGGGGGGFGVKGLGTKEISLSGINEIVLETGVWYNRTGSISSLFFCAYSETIGGRLPGYIYPEYQGEWVNASTYGWGELTMTLPPEPIPEPSTWQLIGIGLAGAGVWRLRKRVLV